MTLNTLLPNFTLSHFIINKLLLIKNNNTIIVKNTMQMDRSLSTKALKQSLFLAFRDSQL